MKNYFDRTIRIVFVASLMTLSSCDKEEASPIHEEELTSGSGKWKLIALTASASGQTEDVFTGFEECEKDDIYYFGEDGTFEIQVGATKCDVNQPAILESGTWEIDGKNLTMVSAGEDPEIVEVKLLNATTLKCSTRFNFSGVVTTINATYSRQPL